MKNILMLAAILILSACAQNTGIVKMGEGTYMVSRESRAAILITQGIGRLKADDLNEANVYCEKKEKQLEIISVNTYQSSNRPTVELQFRCVVK